MRTAAAPATTGHDHGRKGQGRADRREGLRLSWCSDCLADRLFEAVPAERGARTAGDWACTTCGAAYLDGIDLVLVDG